jgi:DNA-binding SARP family transcriptional activator
VVSSRQASTEGDIDRVTGHALAAAEIEPDNDVVIANLISAKYLAGELLEALAIAEEFAQSAKSDLMREIATASTTLIRSSVDFDLRDAADIFDALAERSRRDGLTHFEGISLMNSAAAYRAQGALGPALARAAQSVDALSTSSSGNELASAQYIKATISAYRGDLAGARADFLKAGAHSRLASRAEYVLEFADLEIQVGDAGAAQLLLAEVGTVVPPALQSVRIHALAGLALRSGDLETARLRLGSLDPHTPTAYPGNAARLLSDRAVLEALSQSAEASAVAYEAVTWCTAQGAGLWGALASLALGVCNGQLGAAINALPAASSCAVSFAAELVIDNLDQLEDVSRSQVVEEAHVRPDRWLPGLRRAVSNGPIASRQHASRVLALVGDRSDVSLLNRLGRQKGASAEMRRLGTSLARKLAPRVVVEDLGRVSVRIGATRVASNEVRRKVLTLLCFLLTRPRFAATREEVIDALWPDIDPAAAINSLNQTVYFLRRVFEPEYSEETSAGYVQQDSDVLWLDGELLTSQSFIVSQLIAAHDRQPDTDVAIEISEAYRGRFALDFSYDEWSVDFRDWLHVSYLRIVERQIRQFVEQGQFDRGIAMARRALSVEPRNDELELSVLRLLRSSGSHSAAAEQYAHYAALLKRDLDVDAPPLGAL